MNDSLILKHLKETISEGIYILDANMKIVFINDVAKKLLDVEANTCIGMHCHDFSKGKLCGNTSAICDTLSTKNEHNISEIKFDAPGNLSKRVSLKTKIIKDDSGVVQGVVGVLQDTTDMSILKRHLKEPERFENIIGQNPKMLDMYDSINQVANTDASVLILGESGTGKELIADAIHKLSKRKNGPFVKINCSALTESLLESELFGHVRGSFTGAIRDNVGKFELANRGTIFLDEIGEINPAIQVKLLRVLQEKEILRVGDNKTLKVDVRIIAATNRNLREEVKVKRFREDLYYRLNVFPIKVPSLRERPDDIELLSNYFLKHQAKNLNRDIDFAPDVMESFRNYSWPGNVRELQHAIEYSVIRAKGSKIELQDVPNDIIDSGEIVLTENVLNNFEEINEETLKIALQNCGWNKVKTAKALGIGRTTLWRMMKKYNIDDPSS